MSEPSLEEDSQALVPHNPHHPAYSSIDSENGEIRLLELLPGQYDDPLSMRLLPKKLAEDLEYGALSYAWGTADSPNEAFLNGTLITMRESLDLGLRRLRFAEEPRILWVDALCINQNDVQERSQQVQQMASIYKLATDVLVWLGEWQSSDTCRDQERCEEAFSELLTEASWIESVFDDFEDSERYSMMSGFLKRNDLFTDMDHFEGHLSDIASRSWFSRLWIIQEFVLAERDPVIYIGRHVEWWVNFLFAFKACSQHFEETYEDEIATLRYTRVINLDEMRDDRRLACLSTRTRSLWRWLVHSQDFHATDNRDKVYGLLGLCVFPVADPIVPDYSKSFQKILADATVVAIIEGSPEFYLEFPFTSRKSFEESHGKPSWLFEDLPSFCSTLRGLGVREPFGVSLNERKVRNDMLRVSEDGRILFAKGQRVGTISAAFSYAKTWWKAANYENTCRAAELYDFFHNTLKPMNIAPRHLHEVLNFDPEVRVSLDDVTTFLAGTGNVVLPRIELLESISTKGSTNSPRTLIVTNKGALAMTWCEDLFGIQAGDVIVNLFGYNMPFILRPLGRDRVHVMLNVAQFRPIYSQCRRDWIQFDGIAEEEYALV